MIIFIRYILCVLMCVVAMALPRLRLQARPDGSRKLVAASDAASDTSCNAVFSPRGVCAVVKGPPWLPMEKFNPDASLGPEDFSWLKSAGINVIRLGVMWPGVMPEPPLANGSYLVNKTYLAEIKRIVTQAATYGIYTIIEFHQDTLSEHYCGEGIPLWVAAELREAFKHDFPEHVVELVRALVPHVPVLGDLLDDAVRNAAKARIDQAMFPAPLAAPWELNRTLAPPYGMYTRQQCGSLDTGYLRWTDYQLSFAAGHGFRTIFNTSSLQFRHFLEYWKALALMFRGDTNVMAFEIFNEPWPGSFYLEPWMMLPVNFAKRLQPFFKQIAETIHNIDEERLVSFMPPTIEEGAGLAPNLNWPGHHVCPGLRTIFGGVLEPLADGCKRLWDVSRWMPKDGMDYTAFTEAPLTNQSIMAPHFYMPPQGLAAPYAMQRRKDETRLGVATVLGETCCVHEGYEYGWREFMPSLYWFERSQAGWIVWEYKDQGIDWPDTSGVSTQYGSYGARKTGTGPALFYNDSGEPIFANWQQLAHPSAQFVHGDVLENVFEYWHGRFKLKFIPTKSCSDQWEFDALIYWPADWWTVGSWHESHFFSGMAPMPNTTVFPAGAATVSEVPEESLIAFGLETQPPPRTGMPRLRVFGVHAATTDSVTVTLAMPDFQFRSDPPVGLAKAVPLSHPPLSWWEGLGWPAILCVLLLSLLTLVYKCMRRCCRKRVANPQHARQARDAKHDAIVPRVKSPKSPACVRHLKRPDSWAGARMVARGACEPLLPTEQGAIV